MRLLTAAIIIGLATTACFGQFQLTLTPATGNPANAPQPTPKDAPIGISVPDSPGAADLLAKAADKEQQHQWKSAAEFYQEVLQKYDHRVVPQHIDSDAGIFQYSGVALLVQERFSHWPDEGLNVYRSLYGQVAADALTAAGRDDIAALEKIFWNYFVTDAGKSAGIELMDLRLEAGHFAAAAWIGQRLLDLHPAIEPQRAMILFRTAAAYQWAGQPQHASDLLAQLRDKFPRDTGTIGGRDVVLADALAALLAAPVPTAATQPSEADTWPNFGGPADDSGVSSSNARPAPASRKSPSFHPTSLPSMPFADHNSTRPTKTIWPTVPRWGSCLSSTTARFFSRTAAIFTPSVPKPAARCPPGWKLIPTPEPTASMSPVEPEISNSPSPLLPRPCWR